MTPTRSSYDVVVVGARCAGAATARLLAEAGLSVLLVDRTRLPADTVSTHALMVGAVVQLHRWGLAPAVAATGATPIDGTDVTVGDVSFTAPVRRIGGVERLFAPRRLALDALLADAAVAAGAELCDGVTVTDVLRDGEGRVSGVTGATWDGRAWEVAARWVVGADGVRSTVAGLVDAATHRWSPATSSTHYAYFAGLDGTRYDFTFAARSGVGAIPTDGGLTCVFAACPAEEMPRLRRDLDRGFHALVRSASPALADRLAGATMVTGYRGTRGVPAYLRQPWGPGWLLVGDAGYHIDPYSAHGITDAFRDAELAAAAILCTVDGERETTAMRRYRAVRDDFAAPMYDLTARLASYRLSPAETLDVLSAMGDQGRREAELLAALPRPAARGRAA